MAQFKSKSTVANKAASRAVTKAARKSTKAPANQINKPVTRAAARAAAELAANAAKMLRGAALEAALEAAAELAEEPIARFVDRVAARVAKYPEPEFPADRFQAVSQRSWDALLLCHAADHLVYARRCKQVADGLHSAVREMYLEKIALGLYYLERLSARHPAQVCGYSKSLLFTASMMLANQVLDDASYEVSDWEAASGHPKAAISEAARTICEAFRYRLHPRPRTFRAFEAKILRSLQTPAV